MKRQPFNPDLAIGGAEPAIPAALPKGVLTVWQVTCQIKDAIEAAIPSVVQVLGELSNFKRHSSGHAYFTLKDDRSELACVMWRSDAARVKFVPADGMDVVVSGTVSVFERSGRYQLYAKTMSPRGVGAWELAFRQLCEKLQKEGLFDERHKKALPKYSQHIAVVTSETGAAIHDILDTLKRRFPCAVVFFHPVAVQGPAAAGDIAAALARIGRQSEALGGIDLIILGRGGGSVEDLAAFNQESVARAIFASEIPIISAVGHESDVTIADLIADVRAATPTAAAELAVPNQAEVLDELAYRGYAMLRALRHRLRLDASRLESISHRAAFREPERPICQRQVQVADLEARLIGETRDRLQTLRRRVAELALDIQGLHPSKFLADQRSRLAAAEHRLTLAMGRQVAASERNCAARVERLLRLSPDRALDGYRERIEALAARTRLSVARSLRSAHNLVGAGESRLKALGFRSTLARGFSMTRLKRSGKLIRGVQGLKVGDQLVTELMDGKVDSRVVDANQGELFD